MRINQPSPAGFYWILIKRTVQLAVPALISMGRSTANLGSRFTANLGSRFTFPTQEPHKCARAHSPKHMGTHVHLAGPAWDLQTLVAKILLRWSISWLQGLWKTHPEQSKLGVDFIREFIVRERPNPTSLCFYWYFYVTISKTTRFGQKVWGPDINTVFFFPQRLHLTSLYGIFS